MLAAGTVLIIEMTLAGQKRPQQPQSVPVSRTKGIVTSGLSQSARRTEVSNIEQSSVTNQRRRKYLLHFVSRKSAKSEYQR
jgi:hypothetical protein